MRSTLVKALTANARVARWRLDPQALAAREDQPAVAARALLRRAYGGLLPPAQAASALACLGFTRTDGSPYTGTEVRIAARALVIGQMRPAEPEIDPMSWEDRDAPLRLVRRPARSPADVRRTARRRAVLLDPCGARPHPQAHRRRP